jgi:acetylornithine deacetylase/succinyl-diaminopimelate desuccinylase-like protein
MKKLAALVLVCACLTLQAQSQTLDPHQKLTLDIYRELIEINTVHPHGDNTAAARAMAKRLLDAGFDTKDVEVVEPAPKDAQRRGLVARQPP